MKKLLLILFIATSYHLWASAPQIEGVYVWNPGKDYWIVSNWKVNPNKRRNTEPSKNVWDSLFVFSNNYYIKKSSRFYDVGGKTVESVLEGRWNNRGDYVSFVPFGVNYSCNPNVPTDSSILVNLFEIEQVTGDTIPIKNGRMFVCFEDGSTTKYYTDSTGYVKINYSPDILVILIEGCFSAKIPFPQAGCHYNVVVSNSYYTRNIDADFYKKHGSDLWSCFIDKDSLVSESLYKGIETTPKQNKKDRKSSHKLQHAQE